VRLLAVSDGIFLPLGALLWGNARKEVILRDSRETLKVYAVFFYEICRHEPTLSYA